MRNNKGQYSSPEEKQISPDFEELLGLYLDSLTQQKPGTSQRTVDTRRREVRYWLAFCEKNDINPLAASTPDIRGYIQSITDLADTTIDSYYRSVQSFYTTVENDAAHNPLKLVNDHPCKDKTDIDLKNDYGVYGATAEYQRQHRLTDTDIDGVRKTGSVLALDLGTITELFPVVPGKSPQTQLRNEITLRLSWYTGCRSDELSRMRIGNIDWAECRINIRSAKLNAKENPDLIRRDVFFPKDFKFTLKRWCERVRHSFSAAVPPGEGYVLCTTHSEQMDPSLINDIVKKTARNAGVQRPLRPANPTSDEEIKEWLVTSHRIRRSAISHWVNDIDEIDLHQARRLAGHANIEQTMEYVEPDRGQLAQDYQRGMSHNQ